MEELKRLQRILTGEKIDDVMENEDVTHYLEEVPPKPFVKIGGGKMTVPILEGR